MTANISILYGPEGRGKSTHVRNLFQGRNPVWIDCALLSEGSSLSDKVDSALTGYGNEASGQIDSILRSFYRELGKGRPVIVDHAEKIGMHMEENEAFFTTMLSQIQQVEHTDFLAIFDLTYEDLVPNPAYRVITAKNYDVAKQEFIISDESFKIVVEQTLKYSVSQSFLKDLKSLIHNNMNDLGYIMSLIKDNKDPDNTISEKTRTTFHNSSVQQILKKIELETKTLIQQASIIGKYFPILPFTSPSGFKIEGAKCRFEDLENYKLVRTHNEPPFDYRFTTLEVHESIYKNLSSTDKISWEQVLLDYFLNALQHNHVNQDRVIYLSQIEKIASSLNNYEKEWFALQQLLRMYLVKGDIVRSLATVDKMLSLEFHEVMDSAVFRYLSLLRITLNSRARNFDECLKRIEELKACGGSAFYIDYLQACAFYGTGKLTESSEVLDKLLAQLKAIEANAAKLPDKEEYVMVYALKASLMHHLGNYPQQLGHKTKTAGWYFDLARNRAKQLSDKTTLHRLGSKSGMFMDFALSKPHLQSAIDFFDEHSMGPEFAEASFNLATGLMLAEPESQNDCFRHFRAAEKEFSVIPNANLLYTSNNMAIAEILYKDNFDAALKLLQSKLGTIDDPDKFTFFTIYNNIAMCYLYLEGSSSDSFKRAYEEFQKYTSIIKSDDQVSQYAITYPAVMEILIHEHEGRVVEAHDQAVALNSEISPAFASQVLIDIANRTDYKKSSDLPLNKQQGKEDHPSVCGRQYPDNAHYYRRMNELHLFLAEFRFWE